MADDIHMVFRKAKDALMRAGVPEEETSNRLFPLLFQAGQTRALGLDAHGNLTINDPARVNEHAPELVEGRSWRPAREAVQAACIELASMYARALPPYATPAERLARADRLERLLVTLCASMHAE